MEDEFKDYLANVVSLNKHCCFYSISTYYSQLIVDLLITHIFPHQTLRYIFRSFLKGYSITFWQSEHRDCKEDRIHYFQCGYGPVRYRHGNCAWSGHYVNDFDQLVNYKCPHNGFITGVSSVYSGHHRDRREIG